MTFRDAYTRQVELLVSLLPIVAGQDCFALKGGTAINLFHRDLPRLSVDIDLTFLPVLDRTTSLAEIDRSMRAIGESVQERLVGLIGIELRAGSEGAVTKLFVRRDAALVKVEVTPVIRGCFAAPELRQVCQPVESRFGFAENLLVSFPDLYGGKLVAALDRQHPRDLFDVYQLLDSEGIDDTLRRAFLIYLLSHNRPIHEVLNPRRKDLTLDYERSFKGMVHTDIDLKVLLDAREAMIADLVGNMPSGHRQFLVDFIVGVPAWSSVELTSAETLPAIRWRQRNLDALQEGRRGQLASNLRKVLDI